MLIMETTIECGQLHQHEVLLNSLSKTTFQPSQGHKVTKAHHVRHNTAVQKLVNNEGN